MIPVCTPLLGKNEKKYVDECIATNWISSSGKYIKLFEEGFSHYCGRKYGVTTTNGTTALHLALAALGIGPGDEVIMPTFTIAATAFAVMYCGAKPVFIDSEPATWNIDPDQIRAKITQKTKVILPVHIYGHPCAMSVIMSLASRYNLCVVEDAAQSHGAQYQDKKVGGIGDIGCFSFYGNKIITCGEGGMVVTNNRRIAQRCRDLRNMAFIESKRFWHKEIGFNHRMTNLQAALGLAQFEQIDQLIERRRRNAVLYSALLSGVEGLRLPIERSDVKNVYWMYGILVEDDFGLSRDRLMRKLKEKGVETRTFFIPLHNQPFLKKQGMASKERFPVAEDIARRGLYLPSGSGLTKKEIEYICDCIKEIKDASSHDI